ncbi:MAG: glycosyl hydrolase [Bacteroidota bacterium]
MKRKTTKILLYITAVLSFVQCTQHTNTDDLSWPYTKPENKPGTYWWWMGSAVDKENLTFNLKTLSDAGIGNVHIIPIYGVKGEEEKYIDFLSPKWMNMLDYTVNKAEKLKMNVDMSTTTGWPFGGSHVTSQYAASKIVYEIITVPEGEKISKQFNPQNLETIIAYDDSNHSIDLLDKLEEDGKLNWTAPKGEWRIYILNKEGTGQKVKRAAPGNVGLVLDPFSVDGLKYYFERYDTAFTDYKGINLRAQYHDSYEYYHANWTNEFFKIFQTKNGYDLRNYLPALLDTNYTNIRIKADYRRTLSNLHIEYIETWNKWSNEKGWITRNQAHGAPANLLDLYAASNIPETETFGSRKFDIPGIRYIEENNSESEPPNPLILKFASSAAHVTGKPLIASETGTWLRDHYKAALSQVKPEIDELFFCGINHIFYHGNAYSPKDAPWPGWIFYASTHFEKENAFWKDFTELNKYVTRCQSILQSGKPSNDILLYWPIEDLYHSYPELLIKLFNVHKIDWFLSSQFGELAIDLEEKGYSFDYISDKQLQNVEYKGRSVITGGNSYKTILIPKTGYIPLNTLEQLKKLVANGAVIIFHDSLPRDVPGFAHLEKRRTKLKKSLSELKFKSINKNDLQKAEFGKGYFLLSNDVNSALNYASIKEEKIVAEGINYIRRKHEKGYFYFLTNLSNKKLNSWIPLSVNFKSAVIYDPRFEEKIGIAATRQNKENSEIYLQLQSGESYIVKTYDDEYIEGNAWKYLNTISEPLEIKGEWKIEFIEGGPKKPSSYTTKDLKSWTENNDPAAESFAGTGRYTITFSLPNVHADEWLLDLGKVCESARVKLNDKEIGTLWSFPFNIQVGKYLKQGDNILEIEVTNLSANRIRDLDKRKIDWRKFFFVDVNYKKFDASNWPIMDSGLIGPVKLIPVNYLTF